MRFHEPARPVDEDSRVAWVDFEDLGNLLERVSQALQLEGRPLRHGKSVEPPLDRRAQLLGRQAIPRLCGGTIGNLGRTISVRAERTGKRQNKTSPRSQVDTGVTDRPE